jgi:hypothetical protein
MRRRCLFLVTPPLATVDRELTAAQWSAVRDYSAMGYLVIPVVHPNGTSTPEERELLASVIAARTGARVPTVFEAGEGFDPRHVWDVARRFGLDLSRSILLTHARTLAGLFHVAGVERVLSPTAGFGGMHAA